MLYLTEHRGFTHSLLGFPLMALLTAGVVFWMKRKDKPSFRWLFLYAALGVAGHLFLDLCTSWGTQLLWPDRRRLALDHLFIIDLWYLGIFAAALLAGAFWKKKRLFLYRAGLFCIVLYHFLAAGGHFLALKKSRVFSMQPSLERFAFPQPFSPLRWLVMERTEQGISWFFFDFQKKKNPIQKGMFWKKPEAHPDLEKALSCDFAAWYFWLARVPFWERKTMPDGSTLVLLGDARFFIPELPRRRLPYRGFVEIKENAVTRAGFTFY